jgi:osmotically-inducible protein OsmY
MTRPKWTIRGAALLFAGALSACATFKDGSGDAQISANVRSLLWRDGIAEDSVSVSSRDHIVYLSGIVDTPLEAERAGAIAGEVPGVSRVVNTLVGGE